MSSPDKESVASPSDSAGLSMTVRLQEMLDRDAIRNCLMRYARGIDRCDRAVLQSVYWEDAIDNHGTFNGPALEFVDYLLPRLAKTVYTSTFLGNILIDLQGDFANVETYFLVRMRVAPDGMDTVTAGRYLDRMARRGGEWRISVRQLIIDWYQDHRPLAEEPPARTPVSGARQPTDPLYQFFAAQEAKARV